MAQRRNIPTRRGDPALRSVLQSLLVSELINPSPKMYLISPWITDIPILDNSSGQFRSLVPGWDLAHIRLSKVLVEFVDRGTELVIASRPNEGNMFFQDLQYMSTSEQQKLITIRLNEELHEKGLLTNRFYFAGSFNFTLNGIEVLEEAANLFTDHDIIGKKLVDFSDRWESEV